MTHPYAKSTRKKLRELAGLANEHELHHKGSNVDQFIGLYRQEGNSRGCPLANKQSV